MKLRNRNNSPTASTTATTTNRSTSNNGNNKYSTTANNNKNKNNNDTLESTLVSSQWNSLSSVKTLFLFFFVARTISAIYNNVADCDETFNYWEPTHYLLYGYGFQTWEYSPEYSIRSWAYIVLHSSVGKVASLVFGAANKIAVFYFIRFVLCALCALSEALFVRSAYRRFGPRIALYTFLFLLFSTGMFIASSSFLPSSFAMYFVTMAYAYWFEAKYTRAITLVAFSSIMGWPFVVMAASPLALHVLFVHGPVRSFAAAVASLLYFLVPSVAIDYLFFNKVTCAVCNIMTYNASVTKGSLIFGVEPWTYYFKNVFLNFNVLLPLSLLSVVVLSWFYKWHAFPSRLSLVQCFLYLSPLYVWAALMLYLPHKEERFLFVVYPYVCLTAAITLAVTESVGVHIISILCRSNITSIMSQKEGRRSPRTRTNNATTRRSCLTFVWRTLVAVLVLVFVLLSLSRTIALKQNYGAPLDVYTGLSDHLRRDASEREINVCVGKEWYRFPGNFFLPSANVHLAFVKSGFTGLLPKPFEPHANATWTIPTGMNNMNREESSRYVPLSVCDYVVDLELPHQSELRLSEDTDTWESILEVPFLDNEASPVWSRAYWVPFGYSHGANTYAPYRVLRRRVRERESL